jgi:hypothetical protein
MSKRHLRWIRRQSCVVPDCRSFAAIEAAHVRTAGNAGTGIKPHDKFTVPMCREHHAEQHKRGWRTFERRYGLDLLAEAAKYAESSGTELPF